MASRPRLQHTTLYLAQAVDAEAVDFQWYDDVCSRQKSVDDVRRHVRRAVDDGKIIFLSDVVQRLLQDRSRPRVVPCHKLHVDSRKVHIPHHNSQVPVARLADGFADGRATEYIRHSYGARHLPLLVERRRISLDVVVDQQDTFPALSQQISHVTGCCGFGHAALHVDDRECSHAFPSSCTMKQFSFQAVSCIKDRTCVPLATTASPTRCR